MARQYSVTYYSYDRWKLPLNLAIGFHLLIAASVVYLPDIFKTRPKFEDAYEVNLISLNEPELAPQPQNLQQPEPVEKRPIEEAVKEKAVPIAEPDKPLPPQAEAKPISLKPLKRKIKKKIIQKPTPENDRQKEFEKLKRQRLAEALKAEREAAEKAKLAAEEAARQQKLMEQQLRQVKSQVRSSRTTSPGPKRSGGAHSALSSQYYANVQSHITSFYNLPKFTTWDPALTTIMAITINKNGTIVNQRLKQSSGNATFDQFVRKTIQNANPLPAIPPALKENSFNFILTFTPESIQY